MQLMRYCEIYQAINSKSLLFVPALFKISGFRFNQLSDNPLTDKCIWHSDSKEQIAKVCECHEFPVVDHDVMKLNGQLLSSQILYFSS